MEAPQRPDLGSKVDSRHSSPRTSVRHTRADVLFREIILIFIVAAGVLLGIEYIFPSSGHYIGATKVTTGVQLDKSTTNLYFGTTTDGTALAADVMQATTPLDTFACVRLGDAVARKIKPESATRPALYPRYVFVGAVRDKRFHVGKPSSASVSPLETMPAAARGNFAAEKAPENAAAQHVQDKRAAQKLDTTRPAPIQDLRVDNQNAGQEQNPAQNTPANPAVTDPMRKAPPVVNRPRSVAPPEMITSATMSALLRAETLRLRSVGIDARMIGPGGQTVQLPVSAIIDGISKVEPHLLFVRSISIASQSDSTIGAGRLKAQPRSLERIVRTPLAWPGGSSFYMPDGIPRTSMPANASSIFNAAYQVSSRTTRLPAILLVIGLWSAYFIRLRSIPRDRLRPRLNGIWIGLGCFLAGVVLLVALRFMWHLGPDYIFGSLPVLISVAVAGGIGIGAAGGWVRAHYVTGDVMEEREDNALRSVLHPDKPIEKIEEDRLGFRPVVDALRRFLDNPGTTPPVVLSINGPWGSGKSSVMKMLRTELQRTQRFSTVWFNAWRFHREDQILAAFLKTITSDLRQESRWSARLAWVRLRHYSVWQYLLLLAPVVIVLTATLNEQAVKAVQAVLGWLPGAGTDDGNKAKELVSVFGIGGPLLWVVRMAVPFQLQFRRLYETRDQSKRVGFLDEFAREFDLYREAVGDRKFVIFIDDLDRCPPDKIVDVLKTINLITTSGRAASTTFFVLGYDPKYITRSIELHFKEFTRHGTAIDEHFGAEYLKKMVTLSVSVPTPTPEERTMLARRLGDAETAPKQPELSHRDRLVMALRTVPGWAFRMAYAVSIAALVVILAVRWHQEVPGTVSREARSDSTLAQAPTTQTEEGAQFVVSLEAARAPDNYTMPWWVWAVPMGLVLTSGGALFVRSRPTEAEVKYVRPEKDTEEFVRSVEACKNLLPENPRDVVRVLNLMRMQYLVQCIDTPRPAPNAWVQSGDAPALLDEWECVSYSVLQLRHPALFSYEFFHEKLEPVLCECTGGVAEFYGAQAETLGLTGTLASDISQLEKTSLGIGHMADRAKLNRYVEVNRYVLDAAGELISVNGSKEKGVEEDVD